MPAPGQTFEPLSEDDEKRLAEQRAVVEKFLGDNADNRAKYATAPGKLGLLRALLAAKVFDSTKTYELQCMGVVFGDVFVQHMKWLWRMANDEYGRDPCIKVPGSSVVIFPLTMISKRIEQGQEVDVFDLFNHVAGQATEQAKRADRLAD